MKKKARRNAPLLLAGAEDEVGVGVVDGGDGPEAPEERLLEALPLGRPVAPHLKFCGVVLGESGVC